MPALGAELTRAALASSRAVPLRLHSPTASSARPAERARRRAARRRACSTSRRWRGRGWSTDPAPFAAPALDAFMAAGPAAWEATRRQLAGAARDARAERHPHPLADVRCGCRSRSPTSSTSTRRSSTRRTSAGSSGPAASRCCRTGATCRSATTAAPARSSSAARTSCARAARPRRRRRRPRFGPSARLDIELELGFVVGVPSALGEPVPRRRALDHVFGVVLLNDWSARDLQAWEYQPLGPFLGKSFATSIWRLGDAAGGARARPRARRSSPRRCRYLREAALGARPRARGRAQRRGRRAQQRAPPVLEPAQQLAHLTVNGASLRTGDLFASGTISGPGREERGSLIELSWNGAEPLELPRAHARSSRTATRSCCAARAWARSPAASSPHADGV